MNPSKASSAVLRSYSYTSSSSENEEDAGWTGVELHELDGAIVNPPKNPATFPLLLKQDQEPDPAAPRELVDPPYASIRVAAVNRCSPAAEGASQSAAWSLGGCMAGIVAGIVASSVAGLSGNAPYAAVGGSAAAGAVLGPVIDVLLKLWAEKCA